MAAAMGEYSASASMPTFSSTSSSLFDIPSSFTVLSSHKFLISSVVVLFSLLILEQTVYRAKKKDLPGDTWTIPIIGKFADSMNPTLENYVEQWNTGPLSVVSVFNIFIVLASSNEFTRKIFNSPEYAEPCLVASAKQVLEPDNWVFLNGKAHADYRRGLNALFTRKAISIYMGIEDKIMREHFSSWIKNQPNHHQDIMGTIRSLNMEVSLRVFCGKHIPAHAISDISDKYWLITLALELVNFPLALPGTKIWNAIRARRTAMKWLTDAADKSKQAMAAGEEVACLVDSWVRDMMEAPNDGKTKTDYSSHEIAQVVLSFLFASQDAMSSGVIYLFQHLADHPDILAKVREEHDQVRTDASKALTLDDLDSMEYLKAVVKESLRVKPPVTMVPYKTLKAFPISEHYTAPAGSMIIPTVYPSAHDPKVYPNPEKLIPERWLDPESSANKNPKNYLIFGHGPHKCIGQEYALLHMMNVIVTAAALLDWDHLRTPESDKVQIIATLFPKDGCLLKFSPRSKRD